AAEPRTLEVLQFQTDRLARFVDLPGSLPRVPLGLERRQQAADLGEVGAIIPLVRSGVASEGDLATGHRLLDDLGDLADAVVLIAPPHVEGLRVHGLARSGEDREEGTADVLDVGDGPPG